MEKRVTQKDVARAAGVHPTTVSLAMRKHPSIPEATRERLCKLAQQMGYAPDPVLDALNVYRVAGHRRSFQGVIAWIDCWASLGVYDMFTRKGKHSVCYEAAKERCEQMGFQLETFRLGRNGLSAPRLNTVLRERGIQGVIVPPIPGGRARMNLAWENFSAVAVTRALVKPELHSFSPDHFNNMRTLLRELRHRGARRPGLVMVRHEHKRTDNLRAAAFVMMQADYPVKNATPILMMDELQKPEFMDWFTTHRPDAVVSESSTRLRGWLREEGVKVPGEILIAGISAPEDADHPRIVESSREISHLAVNHLIAMMHRGERGVPALPARVTVPGRWME